MASQRRYQVFVSTRCSELSRLHKEFVEVILDAGHIPMVLSDYSVTTDDDLAVIETAISDCQVYITTLGLEYGSLVGDTGKSQAELEFEIALKHGLLILPFAQTVNEAAGVAAGSTDAESIDNRERRQQFYDRLAGEHLTVWKTTSDFRYLALKALNQYLPKGRKPGLLRDPQSRTIDLLVSSDDNDFVCDIVAQLHGFGELYKRCSENADEKRAAARFFREKYFDQIVGNNVSVFFESGSTIAHVARELAGPLRQIVHIDEGGRPNIQISTNNVLAYLQFWLISRVPCTTFPWGPPSEETFGASYGGLDKIEVRKATYTNEPLDEIAKREIDRLLATPFTLTSRNPTLLLGAVSGVQIGSQYNLDFSPDLDEGTEAVLGKRLQSCHGPHVGSYHNKVFKRFMYATGLPIVIFITASKIDCTISVGDTQFILDSELTWQDFCRRHPVAFCVGCQQQSKRTYMTMFEEMGFQVDPGTDTEPVSAFIARNDAFASSFEHLGVAIGPYV